MKKIYSLRNITIKNLIKVYKKNSMEMFLVEGVKEFEMAVKGKYLPVRIFIYKKIFHQYEMIKSFKDVVISISKKIFQKLVYRKNTGGIVALFRNNSIEKKLNNTIKIPENPFILILDGIEKPGNLGAILRIADAAGVHFIILCNIKTYIFNANVIRSSLGSIFTTRIFIEKPKSILSWLKKRKVEVIVAGFHKKKSIKLYENRFSSQLAIVLGSENKGVSDFWLKEAHKIITIPMFGSIDSLNVSHAMSIIIYEVIRQRTYYYY
ncbi:RNA methyltransferase [Blattabacterium cuenoti]|uniref:RNA methyltransferase n=1 Tax=Blattabacterium cuenoti TaxID=1653831 RepID=UPI00163CD69A|nr:RNA methyltransferase [Blattabacterium cuenoti]